MPTTDPRVDAYIARAAPFAQPILAHLRKLVHAACPDVQEAIKWSMPHFVYRDRILCGMAAFKRHAAFGFRHEAQLLGHSAASDEAMGQFGCLRTLDDLPSAATLKALIVKAMRLNEAGVPAGSGAPKTRKPPLRVPEDLARALAGHADARRHFEAFAPGQRREYIEWLTEAKRPETRAKRLAQTIEWVAEGKRRNWKYERC